MIKDPEYVNWLTTLKSRVQRAQLKAAVSVNQELLQFYWELGGEIIGKQKDTTWGSGFLKRLSHDLMAEFPAMKGFSESNLRFIKRWVLFYTPGISNSVTACDRNSGGAEIQDERSGHQQIIQIPWGHNRVIITKCSEAREALYYVNQVIKHGWSRSVLTHQIEGQLWKREGNAISNFIILNFIVMWSLNSKQVTSNQNTQANSTFISKL
jgi:predicted nuclease of restriction endonuclease-like (RecB) superfamily